MKEPDTDSIRAALDAALLPQLDGIEIFPEIASTSSYLLEQPYPPRGKLRVALALHQTGGRGRLDRRWISPPLSGLCMSVAYTFGRAASELQGLTLATGAAVVNALSGLAVDGVALKWPNDLMARDRKLGGILTEMRSAGAGETYVVTGIGINVDLPASQEQATDSPDPAGVIDLAGIVDAPPSCSALAAAVIQQLFDAWAGFELHGFAPLAERWDRYDWLRGCDVAVDTADGVLSGIAVGIDVDGALLVITANGRRRVVSGSILLCTRPAQAV